MGKAVIIQPGYAKHDLEQVVLAPLGLTMGRLDWNGDRDLLRAGVVDADIVFVRDTPLGADDIATMKKARGIVRYGIGVDTIDLAAAKAKGIKVANVREYGADIEVADHTLALFLAVKRRIVVRDAAVRAGVWQVGQKEPIGRIGGSTLGIIGFGRIGRAVLARFRAFGITRCLVHDPFVTPDHLPNDDIDLTSLDALAAASDIITLHAPSTPDNYHCINAHFLSLAKRNCILVNTARGSLVDESALYMALSTGRILGAGLDVFEREPPQSNPLLTLSNVVVSDHAAWYSEATVEAIQAGAAEQARQILAGEMPTNWVNP